MFNNDFIVMHVTKGRQQELIAEAEQERLAVRVTEAAERITRRVRRLNRRNRTR